MFIYIVYVYGKRRVDRFKVILCLKFSLMMGCIGEVGFIVGIVGVVFFYKGVVVSIVGSNINIVGYVIYKSEFSFVVFD